MTQEKLLLAHVVMERAGQAGYTYLVPEEIKDQVAVGDYVMVPLRNRKVHGFISQLNYEEAPDYTLRTVQLLKKRVLLPKTLFTLAQWASSYYQSTLSAFLNTMIPNAVRKGVEQQRIKIFTRTDQDEPEGLTKRQSEVLACLPVGGSFTLSEATQLAACSPSTIDRLVDAGALSLDINTEIFEHHISVPDEKHSLTDEQAHAVQAVQESLDETTFKPYFLYGVTGSGKTLVYMELAEQVIKSGKQVLILLPEIGLTPQLAARFRKRFERVSIWHSGFSDGERSSAWHAAAKGEKDLIIGTRSALFAPLDRVGLIIVDEEHDHSYKQDKTPRYQGRDLAVVYAQQLDIPIVLGSATPSCETIYNVRQQRYEVLQLRERPSGAQLPQAEVVDMREECKRQQQRAVLSDRLIEALQESHQSGHQSIILLNRRGWSPVVSCPRCGYTCECEHCDISLTWHKSTDILRCHLCDFTRRLPDECPVCGHQEMAHRGIGTERLAALINEKIPSLRIARMDADTISKKHGHAEIIQSFARGDCDCLLGTQMVAKGLDFPRVSLVGVVDADHGLAAPDFRAAERTYQLLAQVAGRAGRADVHGSVIVQAYDPKALAIDCALFNKPKSFFDAELALRERYAYPPFTALLHLMWRGEKAHEVEMAAKEQCKKIETVRKDEIILGPSPAALAFAKGQYHWHCLVKASSRGAIQQLVKRMRKSHILDTPKGVLLVIDIDPYDC